MKPMLAAVLTREPCWPVMATPKINGWWCEIRDGQPRTRSGGVIINDFTRAWLAAHLPSGFKFELQCAKNFNLELRKAGKKTDGCGKHKFAVPEFLSSRFADHNTTAAAMRRAAGRPDFRCHVFDYVFDEHNRAYADRIADRDRLVPCSPAIARRVHFLQPRELRSMAELLRFEAWCVAEGFEGVMLNAPGGIYKSGRSTEREGFLVKVKREDDGRVTAWERIRKNVQCPMSNH